ncbi:unnamed protein product [Phytophthora fragariaefolia]|uniref:Unnamed protein product n=1 Tax=Phytophthora fragariaefolia TaxID=1490495 RepID=A0A9W6XR95_9STRA|nr:unnamed protein product [Phytophthora fragariaefolia]
MTEQQRAWTINAALDAGDRDVCAALLPPGRAELDYVEFCAQPHVVARKLDCGYFRRDWEGAVVAIRDLVTAGRLDLIARLADEHRPPPEHVEWVEEWCGALADACAHGDLAVFKFLLSHPTGQRVVDEMGRSSALSDWMRFPAEKGNVELMAYLHEQGAAGPFGRALIRAISGGRMDSVQWLLEHFQRTDAIPEYCVMDEAARRGRVDMLQLFHGLDPSDMPGFFVAASPPPLVEVRDGDQEPAEVGIMVDGADRHRKVLQDCELFRQVWVPTDPMDDAAANGQLQAVQWLHKNCTEGCTSAAMDEAAANGFLDVVQWLHVNRTEGCSSDAMDFAAEGGHLEIVQWLHANTTAGCTTAAMDLAAAAGHLKTLKWLASNRSEGCTAQAIERAVSNGHLAAASWLTQRYLALTASGFTPPVSKNKFDVLLYLHANHPEAFTPAFVRGMHQMLNLTRKGQSNDSQIKDWLKQHYPVPDDPEGQRARAQGLAGAIAGNIAQQIAGQLGGAAFQVPRGQPAGQGPARPLTVLDMMMSNIMVAVRHGDDDDMT